jgi:EAL domain-containing protein (putative c-di-GMP-specific phosphodiesterase class I)
VSPTGLPDDPDSAAIAQLIVAMANALRMETVAEGVETREQMAFLRRLGCRTAQGYLYSPAITPAEIARFALDGRTADMPTRVMALSRG